MDGMGGMGLDRKEIRKMRADMRGFSGGKGLGGKGTPGAKTDPSQDMEGKPGPNGEDPSTGKWFFVSKGAGAGKRWKWTVTRSLEEREAKKARKAEAAAAA